jgi:DNA polymerase III alpha subunit
VRACGIVTVRQRPSTASGTIFTSIEDETGAVNVIIWPDLVERQRKEVLGATLLGVIGTWQRQGEVRHLVADELVDLSPLLGRLMVGVGIFIEKEVSFPLLMHRSRAQQAGPRLRSPTQRTNFQPCKQNPARVDCPKIRQSTLSQYRRGLAGCQEGIIHALCG